MIFFLSMGLKHFTLFSAPVKGAHVLPCKQRDKVHCLINTNKNIFTFIYMNFHITIGFFSCHYLLPYVLSLRRSECFECFTLKHTRLLYFQCQTMISKRQTEMSIEVEFE